ncbi:MAG: hypothetical protein PVJ57_03680 [Phycisphaerae bacterium]
MYRCRAVLLPGFIQQLAVAYVAHGYWFYVPGWIPLDKDAEAVDRKLIEKYGIDISKWERARRKKAGLANLHYLRHGRTFILIATHGQHRFFEEEANMIRDIRRSPFKIGGYSVSHRNGHASVRIAQASYNRLKIYLTDLGSRRSAEHMENEFRMLHYEPYAPIRRQLLTVHRAVNRARKQAGFEPVPLECLRLKRRIYRPFELAFPHVAD